MYMNENLRISTDDIVQRVDEQFMISQLGDEVVLMDIQQGHYINVNPVGSFIWDKLVTPVVVKELIASLVEVYDISAQQCEVETLGFLYRMREHHMVSVHAG
jgi:hypothetical protein